MIKLKPLKKLLAMSKEKIDETLAPVRVRQIKSKAELEMAKIDEKLISTEARILELCTQREINFDLIIKEMDDYSLNERRQQQFQKIITELFPEEA